MQNDHIAYLGLGSNLGDRLATLRQARQALQQTAKTRVIASSFLYRTTPIGGPPDQPDYLNGVVKLATGLEPLALLQRCQTIETTFGRQRSEHWGARTLDIDLLLFADRVIDSSELQLPHPRMTERQFVLQPLCDLAPALRHPKSGQTLTLHLRQISPRQGVHRLNELW